MSIETLLQNLAEALDRNTAALAGSGGEVKTAAGKTTEKAPDKAPAGKAAGKTTEKAPDKAPAGKAAPGKAPLKAKVVSVEDAAAIAAAFLSVDDEAERLTRREFIVKLVTSLKYDKVRGISDAEDRSIFARYVEQATQSEEDGIITEYPVIESDEPEDEV